MINVGIIGCGFVGGALKDWLEHNNPECKLFITDPAKGYNDDLSNIDIAFLQIHVRKSLSLSCQMYLYSCAPLFSLAPVSCSRRKLVIVYTTCPNFLLNALI